MSDPQQPIRYAVVTADTYGDTFAGSCSPPVETRRGILLVGTCPRCGDQMQFPFVTEVFKAPAGPAPVPAASPDTPMLCTCRGTHPARPEGEEGCGAFWNIRLTRPGT